MSTKTKSEKLIKILRNFGIYGFEAVQVADYLLNRANGDFNAAQEAANNPYKINGRWVW